MKIISRWRRSIDIWADWYRLFMTRFWRCIWGRNFPFPLTWMSGRSWKRGKFETRKNVCEKGEAKMILIDNGGMGGFYREIYEGFADFLLVRLIRFKAIWSFENATRYVIWLKAWEALRPERSALITIIDVPRWRILFSNGGIRCTICSRLAIFRSFPCVYVVSWEREIFNKLILNIVKYCTHFNEHFLLYLFHPILCEKLLRIIRFDSTDHELFEVLLSLQKLC